ncbi:MAG: hypothetical protein WCG23_12480 [bacterium]
MSKKKFYYAEAQRLYTEEQMTIEEIAERFHISVRIIKYWKDGNDWSGKRQAFLDSKQVCLQDFDIFVRNMLSDLSENIDTGIKISSGRLYSFVRQMDTLIKFKKAEADCKKFFEKYPDFCREKSEEKPKTIPPELIRQIRRDFLGMND